MSETNLTIEISKQIDFKDKIECKIILTPPPIASLEPNGHEYTMKESVIQEASDEQDLKESENKIMEAHETKKIENKKTDDNIQTKSPVVSSKNRNRVYYIKLPYKSPPPSVDELSPLETVSDQLTPTDETFIPFPLYKLDDMKNNMNSDDDEDSNGNNDEAENGDFNEIINMYTKKVKRIKEPFQYFGRKIFEFDLIPNMKMRLARFNDNIARLYFVNDQGMHIFPPKNIFIRNILNGKDIVAAGKAFYITWYADYELFLNRKELMRFLTPKQQMISGKGIKRHRILDEKGEFEKMKNWVTEPKDY